MLCILVRQEVAGSIPVPVRDQKKPFLLRPNCRVNAQGQTINMSQIYINKSNQLFTLMIRRLTTNLICFVYRLAYKIMIHDEDIVTVESYFSKLKYVKCFISGNNFFR